MKSPDMYPLWGLRGKLSNASDDLTIPSSATPSNPPLGEGCPKGSVRSCTSFLVMYHVDVHNIFDIAVFFWSFLSYCHFFILPFCLLSHGGLFLSFLSNCHFVILPLCLLFFVIFFFLTFLIF